MLVHSGWNRDVEKSNHHFAVGLLVPAHLRIRFRIWLTIVFETRGYISYNLKFVY